MRSFGIETYVNKEILVFVVLMGICAGLFIIPRRVLPPKGFIFLLSLVLISDLIYAARDYQPTAPRSWIFPETNLTNYLQARDPAPRVGCVTAGINPGLFPQCGLEQLWGYEGIYPQRNIAFLGRLGIPTAEAALAMEPVCGIAYYLHDPENPPRMPFDNPQRFKKVHTADGIEVYENLRAFPRAFLVNHAEVVENPDEMFDMMADPAFQPRKICLLEKPLPEPLSAISDLFPGSAEVVERSTNEVVVKVSTPQASILVLTDAYFPGWCASIHGTPTEVFPAYSLFRAVRVPEGHHTIVFRFQPWSFRIGLLLSSITLVLALLLGFWQLWRVGKEERADTH